jgi:hypothetical protein
MCTPTIEKHGATPANVQWTVVRGDTARLNVKFLEDDESTLFDTEGWEYRATVYDPNGDVLDELEVEYEDTSDVTIVAPASITENWGTAYKSVVAELSFDLQAVIPESGEDTIWTPVIGTICVLGDITPGGSL